MTPATHGDQSPDTDMRSSSQSASACTDVAPAAALPARPRVARRPFRAALTRRCLLLALGCVLLSFFGCTSQFDGGGFPIGKTRLSGMVVTAESPHVPLANALIAVQTSSMPGHGQTLQQRTDAQGFFDFGTISASVASNDALTLTATPDPRSGHQAQQVAFTIISGQASSFIVSLPSNTFDVNQAVVLSIAPSNSLLVRPGSSVSIQAQLSDPTGKILPVTPTLLYEGNFGSINASGQFTASTVGMGTITAFWYNNLHASSVVQASLNAPEQPPAPPNVGGPPNVTPDSRLLKR